MFRVDVQRVDVQSRCSEKMFRVDVQRRCLEKMFREDVQSRCSEKMFRVDDQSRCSDYNPKDIQLLRDRRFTIEFTGGQNTHSLHSSNMSGTHFLFVLLNLIPVTRTLFETECPPPEDGDCTRNMTSNTFYANLRTSDVNYLCDTKTDGGGWIVFQRRVHRDTNFNRKWKQYKHGFGSPCSDYWLGNEFLYRTLQKGKFELRVDMEFRDRQYFTQYSEFSIENEANNYRLHISPPSGGTARDSLHEFHNNMDFSTPDRDNDRLSSGHCAMRHSAGWWFNDCHISNLNGHFAPGEVYGFGVEWYFLTTHNYSLSLAEMKIRQVS
ncbi:Ficolin-1 [Bulinus truncatus]|nr:Ficolin-1 [Bulinus truncatus]